MAKSLRCRLGKHSWRRRGRGGSHCRLTLPAFVTAGSYPATLCMDVQLSCSATPMMMPSGPRTKQSR